VGFTRARPALVLLVTLGMACGRGLFLFGDSDSDTNNDPVERTDGEDAATGGGERASGVVEGGVGNDGEEGGGSRGEDAGPSPPRIECNGALCGEGEKCCFGSSTPNEGLRCRSCSVGQNTNDFELDCQGPDDCPTGQRCCLIVFGDSAGHASCRESCSHLGATVVLCDPNTKVGCEPEGLQCQQVWCSEVPSPLYACGPVVGLPIVKGCKF